MKGPASGTKCWTETQYEMGKAMWQVRGEGHCLQTGPWHMTGENSFSLPSPTPSRASSTLSKIGKTRERERESLLVFGEKRGGASTKWRQISSWSKQIVKACLPVSCALGNGQNDEFYVYYL